MKPFSMEEVETRKRAIFDAMSPRQQNRILKRGYADWDPFEAPKDPIDIRKDKTKRTAKELMREFLYSRGHEDYSNAYGGGVIEICIGLVNDDDRFLGMYEFSCWYNQLLKKEGHE
jgi:hypothetical protein